MDFTELEEICSGCTKCAIGLKRKNCVFGCGNKNADIMFIGEAPGQTEDEEGIPFVGKAGKHFDKFLTAVGMERDDVYIANILKCRPPNNRDPDSTEEDACIGYLREQFRLIRPKVLVCLGRISAMRLIKPDFRITREHGQWFYKGGIWMTAVYHPAALLRDPVKKEDMLRDMMAVREKLEELK